MNAPQATTDPGVPDTDAYDLETVETDLQKTIDRFRDQANQMEAALARAPANIRKMTRANARLLGIHF